jgi:hypothetical protein
MEVTVFYNVTHVLLVSVCTHVPDYVASHYRSGGFQKQISFQDLHVQKYMLVSDTHLVIIGLQAINV